MGSLRPLIKYNFYTQKLSEEDEVTKGNTIIKTIVC